MIPCTLVHHTGTIIRFRTSQLDDLPIHSRDIQLLLPTGRVVSAHFQRNTANPNISGADLVRYIKRVLPFGNNEAALLEEKVADYWQLHRLSKAEVVARQSGVSVTRVRAGRLDQGDLSKLLKLADEANARGRRIDLYKRVLRPRGLRRLMLGLVGASCMVDGCESTQEFDSTWGDGSGSAIVEVHHIEEVAKVIDHQPKNLCVLCANHHRFLHSLGNWDIEHDGPNVMLSHPAGEILIERPAGIF